MEYRDNNIFYNVIRNETSLTEVFCNLMRYKAFRDLFLKFVDKQTENFSLKLDEISYKNFETEKDFGFSKNDKDEKIGRGDLILGINGVDYIFEIKIETTTKTTTNQPNGYLKYLEEQYENGHKKRLFFILPKKYKHKDKLKNIEQKNMLYWEDFFEEIKKSELNKLNMFVDEFYNMVYDNWFYFSKLDFSPVELNYMFKKEKLQMENSAIPTIMMKILNIVDELRDNFKSNRYDENKDSNEYAFFIKNSDSTKILWFGIDYTLWEKHGKPLAIGFKENDNDKYFKKFQNVFSSQLIKIDYEEEDTSWYFLPIEINILKSEDISAIKKVIEDVIEKIGMEL